MVPDAPDALAQLAAAGVAGFRTPEACADAVAAALKRRAPRTIPAWSAPPDAHRPQMLDERESYALIEKLGIACAPSVVLEPRLARAPELPFRYPVAVKVLSPDIMHKTRTGGVRLGVNNAEDLRAAHAEVQSAGRRYDSRAAIRGVLVQPMLQGAVEALVGYRAGADVGPFVTVAAGGRLVEVYRDRSLRLAPVDIALAWDMIREVRAFHAMIEAGAEAAADFPALARAIVALSQLAVTDEPKVWEAEINPLLVRAAGEGAIALDAVVRLAKKA
jgi:acyl-CoA synthetase (NDP forming)